MAGRTRPVDWVNPPTAEQIAEADTATTAALRTLDEAAETALLTVARISHPVERAKAAMRVRQHTTTEMATVTDELFRDAVVEAYARGRAEHGWYGYGALAEELGLSRARVQQVVNGTWKGAAKDTGRVTALRESADRARQVKQYARAGRTAPEIARTLGMSPAEVRDLLA